MTRWLLLLVAAALLVHLGQQRFMRMDDEGLYTRIAVEMFQHNDWTQPTWFGDAAWYKPPGLYWSMFPFIALVGPGLLAGRLAAVAWSLLTLWVSWRFADRAYGRNAAWLTLGLLATAFSFMKYARLGMMEAPMTFFYIATLYCFWRAQQGDKGPWLFAAFTAAGASTLVKGPISPLVLGLTVVLFAAVAKRWDVFRSRQTLPGVIVSALLVALWPLMVLARGLWQPWFDFFIVRENLGKFANIYYSPLNIWGMYLGHLAPWALLFLVAVWLAARRGWWREEPALLLNLSFLLCMLTIFTLPATRNTWYSVPALPEGAFVLAAVYGRAASRAMRIAEIVTGVLLLLVGDVLFLVPRAIDLGHAWVWVIAAGVALAASGIVLMRGRLLAATVCAAAALTALAFLGGSWMYDYVSPEAKALLHDRPVSMVRLSPYDWSYEAGQLVTQITEPAEAAAALQHGDRVVLSQTDLDEFQLPASSYRIVSSWTTLRRRLSLDRVAQAFRSGDRHLVEEPMLVLESHP